MTGKNVRLGAMLLLFAGMPLMAQEKSEPERKGTVSGLVAAKGGYWIEVKADGEEKARRYDCGSDQKALRAVKDTEVGCRIRLEWRFLEVFRVVRIDVLKKPG
jgi:hypothetical protein